MPTPLPKVNCLAFVLFLCSSVFASFEVAPFVLKLQVGKGQMSGWLEVKPNQDKRPVAVALRVLQRNLDLDGVETNDSVGSTDLTVYPSELVVYPGEKVKVQVTWSGKTPPPIDRAYTILASEVPIDIKRDEPTDHAEVGFKTLVRYRLVVALETQKKGLLSVVSSRKTTDDKAEVIVENKGGGRIPMEGFHLLIGGKTYQNLPGMSNAIMPGDKRRFVLPLKTPPTAAEIQFGASDGPLK
jgi:P pilus assembly chaperone PapD